MPPCRPAGPSPSTDPFHRREATIRGPPPSGGHNPVARPVERPQFRRRTRRAARLRGLACSGGGAMATWADVDELAGRLPGAELGVAHEGAPAWHAGRHTFARLRCDDDGRELVQVWTGEMDTAEAL